MQPRHARVSVPPGAPAEIRFTRWLGTRETLVVEPVGSYVICCVQRTASWLLAHTLADTGMPASGLCGRIRGPGEPVPDVERIVRLVRFAEWCEDGYRR